MDCWGWTAFSIKRVSFTLGKWVCLILVTPDTDGSSGGIVVTGLAAPAVPQMCPPRDVRGAGRAGVGAS